MIKEIVQFTKALPEETFGRNLQLKEGLYMFLDVQEENGKIVLKNVDKKGNLKQEDFMVFKTGDEDTPLVEKCLKKTAFIDPVSSNKAWNRSIFGLSCNPFALCFKKEHYIDEKKYSENFVKNAIEEYFKNSKKYWQKTNYKDVYNKRNLDGNLWGISNDLSTFADKKLFPKHHSALFDLNTRITGKDAIQINRFMKIDIPKPIPIFVAQDEMKEFLKNKAEKILTDTS